jgi:CRP-like cAMP-binding protein
MQRLGPSGIPLAVDDAKTKNHLMGFCVTLELSRSARGRAMTETFDVKPDRLRVLIVEDDYLIAQDLAGDLASRGHGVLGPFPDNTTALRALRANGEVDVAVVDINLRGNVAYPIALELEGRGIPFLFATAYAPTAIPKRFSSVPRLGKPYLASEIDEAIINVVAAHRAPGGGQASGKPRAALAANPLVRKLLVANDLGQEDQALLQHISRESRFVEASSEIAALGSPISHVRLVMSGVACRQNMLRDGKRTITAFLLPGDLCDFHITILDRMDHSIAAISDCVLIDIPARVVDELVRHPAIHRALLWSALVDAAIHRDWLANIGARPGEQRLAHFLCEWVTRMDTIGHLCDGACDFPLTQEDLADAVGMSQVHVNRSIQAVRRKGVIALRNNTLTVLDWGKLISLGEFDGDYLHRKPGPQPVRQAV